MRLNVYKLVAEVYGEIVTDLGKWIRIFQSPDRKRHIDKWVDYHLPDEYILGGSRKSGKTFAVFIISLIAASAIPNVIVLIDRLNSNSRIDTYKQIMFIMTKIVMLDSYTENINKGEMEITLQNKSIVVIRSVYSPTADKIEMKGVARLGFSLAILIHEECNPYKQQWFSISSEAVDAEKKITFSIFNPDTIRQYIVHRLQKLMPEAEHSMLTDGYQKKLLRTPVMLDDGQVVQSITRCYRTNFRVVKGFLTKAEIIEINRRYKEDPIRGRVARDGLNGSEGKRLYYNLDHRHFIKPAKTQFAALQKLPYMLFERYRIGVDEGHAKDKFALTFWGITRQGRAIRLEKWVVTPKNSVDLNINDLSVNSVKKIIAWSRIYRNMVEVRVNIRVEWAGNGVAILQTMRSELYKTNLNYTIDKARKAVGSQITKSLSKNIDSQPQLESRAAVKNLLFGRNQILFWDTDEETTNEYFGRARDDEGLIKDGMDHEGDADDYALIPEYPRMVDKRPTQLLQEEIQEIIKGYNIAAIDKSGAITYGGT